MARPDPFAQLRERAQPPIGFVTGRTRNRHGDFHRMRRGGKFRLVVNRLEPLVGQFQIVGVDDHRRGPFPGLSGLAVQPGEVWKKGYQRRIGRSDATESVDPTGKRGNMQGGVRGFPDAEGGPGWQGAGRHGPPLER
jgi:hypothetical protein